MTHLVAGLQVPIPKALQSRYGIGEHPTDGYLLQSVDVLESVLSAGIVNDWISCAAVDRLLSSDTVGSAAQAKESFKLANHTIDTVRSKVLDSNIPAYNKLSANNFPSAGEKSDWEYLFGADVYEPEQIAEYEVPSQGLIAAEAGLCVMLSEINSELNQALKVDISQFIQFCCRLSHHASSIDMILDDGMKWMTIGEIADLNVKDENALMKAAGDERSFLEALQQVLGEDFEEELFISSTTLADYYVSYKQAKEIHKELTTLSKRNVSAYLKRIKSSTHTPAWLITGTEILLSQCNWTVNSNSLVRFTGHVPFEFTKPYAFGFSFEEHLFNSLHETFMYGEEDITSMCVPYCKETPLILANLDLGETLLLYANEMLNQKSEI